MLSHVLSSLRPLLLPLSPPTLCQQRNLLKDFRKSFEILRESPVGPYKKLAPGVKDQGRVGKNANYRRIIHYPEDGKYTIRKLPITKLGGRDPETGRKVIEGVGGGSKQKARWIDWKRIPDGWNPEGPDLVERILSVQYDPTRDAQIALTGRGKHLRWQIATENMKAGDLIRSSTKIPDIPVKPIEGNSYPLGALPVGTTICLCQFMPGTDYVEMFHAEDSGTILRKDGNRVIIKSNNNLDYSLDKTCQCVVGKVSIHPLKALAIGSPNRLRWLGHRPRSGLFQRKTGRFGRKIRKPPPVKEMKAEKPDKDYVISCRHFAHGQKGQPQSKKRKLQLGLW